MGKSLAEMEKAAIAIEEGQQFEVVLLSRRKDSSVTTTISHRNKAILIQQRRLKSLCYTIFTLLMITLVFLVLSYEYEPSKLIKRQSISKLFKSGSSGLLHWHWS